MVGQAFILGRAFVGGGAECACAGDNISMATISMDCCAAPLQERQERPCLHTM